VRHAGVEMELRSARPGPIGPLPSFGRRFRPGEGPGGDPNSPENIERRNRFDVFTGEAPGGIEHIDPRLGPIRGVDDIDCFTGEAANPYAPMTPWPMPERRQ
jgi:hypothetical protein